MKKNISTAKLIRWLKDQMPASDIFRLSPRSLFLEEIIKAIKNDKIK